MSCPNCKAKMSNAYTCSKCGVDAILFTKTIKVSNTLYNKGLRQAKTKDLWGAIDSLTKSISFNKNNHNARNLLGLIYYEIGKVGDALKQWIISASVVKKDNFASKYIETIQKNQKELYAKNEAVLIYNQALAYIQQNSNDLAIIQLKKSIEANPKFIDSMNLLALCYIRDNKKEEAKELMLQVLRIDMGNEIALGYHKEIAGKYPVQFMPQKIGRNTEVPIPSKPYGYNRSVPTSINDKFVDKLNFMQIISFLAGGFCTALLMYVLVWPDMVGQRDSTITDLTNNLAINTQRYEQNLLEANQKIAELEEHNRELLGINNVFNMQLTMQEKMHSIDEATDLFNANNAEEAAEILYLVDFSVLPDNIAEQAYILRTNIFTSAGLSLYNRGLAEFNASNFEEARILLERSLRYAPEDANYIDDALYFRGRIAEEQGYTMLAVSYFTRVIEDFPDSNMFSNATNRLGLLEQG